MPIFDSIVDTIGGTPLVRLGRVAPAGVTLLGKIESRNPCGSVKDRIALAMIEDAERRGVLRPGATLLEPTSGNTGIGLAFACAAKRYKLVLTMPETMSAERVALLKMMGAEVVLTPGSLMREAVQKARTLATERGAVMLHQFENPANPEAHRRSTAEEIWGDTGGNVDVFVAGVGTGGTITGVGEVLKARRPGVEIVAVEPKNAAALSGGRIGPHAIQGIGAGFVPAVLSRAVLDKVIQVTEDEAFDAARRLAREEGVLAGPSCGAALHAALTLASSGAYAGKTFVVMLPDSGERYLSMTLFSGARR